jgi:hypothetical protein
MRFAKVVPFIFLLLLELVQKSESGCRNSSVENDTKRLRRILFGGDDRLPCTSDIQGRFF